MVKNLKGKISSAFSPLGNLIKGAQEKWKAFTDRVSASAKTAFAPLKNAFDSLFGAALKNGLASLGSAFLSAVTSTRQMQAAIGHLKEGFAQMTAPIAQAVAPALAALTNGLATVLAYAGQLFSFLTGKTVKGAEGTAAAVADVGKAAGGTAKKTAEAARSLADFDEITRLDAPKESGSAAGGGGGAANAETPGWAAASPFLDQVLAMIEGGEWKKAGQLVAEKMNGLLQSWDAYAFGYKLGTGVQNALALLSGFITGAPWEENGQALADGTGRMLAKNQWNGLGEKLATAFNGLLEAIDPADLAAVVFAKLNILVRTVGSFFEKLDFKALAAKVSAFVQAAFYDLADSIASVDWGAVGGGIAAFFQNLDWGAMAQSLGTLLGQMFFGAVEFMAGLLGEPFAFLKEKFLEGFGLICGDGAWPVTGEQIVAGILAGLLNIMAGIGAWIRENIFQPFLAGFCDAFGIDGFSTVAADWGGQIIAGLLNGLAGAWERVSAFLDGIRQGFAAVWGAVCTATAQAFSGLAATAAGVWGGIAATVRGAVNGIIGFVNGLIGGLEGGINLIADGFNSLSADVPDWVPGVGGAHLGFALGHVSLPRIPYLAQGAVIPANREFVAVLGDQTHGTNVEAPLAVIEQAVANVLDRNSEVLTAMAEYIVGAIERKQTDVYIGDDAIGRAAARYQRRQAVMRGGVF